MTDLTNKSIEEVNILIQKYAQLLDVSDAKKQDDIPVLAIIFEIGINYINTNHKDLPKDWKAWSMVVVKNWYYKGKIRTNEDIQKTIDKFIDFWKSEYKKYCEDIISASDYYKDKGFTYKFIKTEIGSH